jgi:hypothetical protein
MLDGLNFKEFVVFLSAFSPCTTPQQKIECQYIILLDLVVKSCIRKLFARIPAYDPSFLL